MIVQISDLELYLQKEISGTDDKDRYEFLIGSVQDLAESITNRLFDVSDYDETFDMDGSEVSLNQYPVNSVDTVEYGNPFGTVDRTELGTTEYLRYDDIGVLRLSITARKVPQYVRVVYNAGWTDANPSDGSSNAPDSLKQILMDQIQNTFVSEHVDPNLKSEKQGKYSWTRLDETSGDSSSSFANKLSRYIRSDL